MGKTIIGVDMGGTLVNSGLIKNNKIEKSFSLNISADQLEQDVLNEVIQSIEKVYDENVSSIGIGVPSLVDVEKGIVYAVQNIPSWREVHLREKLESRFGIPVYVNNDSNCFAVGVKYFGRGRDFNNIVGLTIGTGMGAGVIINGKLYSGVNCGAGEFGMIPYKNHTYEYYCSGQFFKKEYGISGPELYKKANQGDKSALGIFEIFGSHLGKAITTILYAVDPEIVILGGSVSKAYQFFKTPMQQEIDAFEFRHILNRFTIDVNQIPDIAILGAATLYKDALKNLKKDVPIKLNSIISRSCCHG